jgi:DNA-directed RNA polymerase specialized sigma24 family protein
MNSRELDPRLSLIATQWSLVYLAHNGTAESANSARRQLLERYGCAISRYLHKLLSDPHAADEVFQQFALQLVQGKLGGADPQHGRFRNFVKGTLFHLVADYHKRQRQWPRGLPCDDGELVAPPTETESDRQFLESWCDELLARAWSALEQLETRTGQPFYSVLRLRADHPEMRSPQVASQFSARFGRTFSAVGVRQLLHRAREKFAAFLVDEVAQSLTDPTPENVEEELVELGLLDYCSHASTPDLRA